MESLAQGGREMIGAAVLIIVIILWFGVDKK